MNGSLQKIVISLMILGGIVIVIVQIFMPESEIERKAAQAVETETVEIENCCLGRRFCVWDLRLV